LLQKLSQRWDDILSLRAISNVRLSLKLAAVIETASRPQAFAERTFSRSVDYLTTTTHLALSWLAMVVRHT